MGGGDDGGGSTPNVEVPVTGLSNVPDTAYVNGETDLCSVTVAPANADRKTIDWTVKNAGNTGVTDTDLADKKFTPTNVGTLVLTATVKGGKADGTDFTKDETITVKADDREELSGTVTISTDAIKGVTLEWVNPANTLTNASGVPVYHWQRSSNASGNWTDIEGAYSLTYTLGDADVNQYIRLVVSYSGAKGSVASNVAGPVAASLPSLWKPETPIDLSTGWASLLTTIQQAGNLVSLDLSDCTMGNGVTVFDPGTNNTGESKILSLVLPDVATSIKDDGEDPAFKNFTSLTSVSGKNISTVGSSVFSNCVSLTEADFPKAEAIGMWAFDNCIALKTVNLPKVKTIGGFAFYACVSLTEADLPAAEAIDTWAFSRCTALKTASFPKVKTIGDEAFHYTALETVNLPAALTTIGDAAFAGCADLTTITVDSGNTAYKAQNGMLLNYAGDTLVAYPSAKGTVALDTAITSIGSSAFYENTALTTVNAPGAENIGGYAFYGCAALTTASLPKVESIGSMAFDSCVSLIALNAPEAKSIGSYAFEKCAALTTVSLPKAESIGALAFAYNPALKTVNFPKAETTGRSVFYGCTALTSVSLPAVKTIKAYAFQNTGGTALAVTLGSTAPALEYLLFARATDTGAAEKTVTVRIPTGATGYGSSPTDTTAVNWGNGFRGGGWDVANDGTAAGFPAKNGGASFINSNITLMIMEEQHH
jgi:hypothetical protein